MNKPTTLFVCAAVSVRAVFAALVPMSPEEGQTVELLSPGQKDVLGQKTLEERIAMTKDKSNRRVQGDKYWRKSLPFTLTFRATENEGGWGFWTVRIGKKADLSDAHTWYLLQAKAHREIKTDCSPVATQSVVKIEVPRVNLEIATRYYWQVARHVRVDENGKKVFRDICATPVSSFVTEDLAPRWIAIEGRVGNMRDLGGRIGLDGRRVRQGMVYRGQGLNDNSTTGERKGRNRLTVEDVEYLTGTLGIRTDLDLRGQLETADLAVSPLGKDVRFVLHPSYNYKGIFTAEGKKVMAENFRVFCDRDNYPIYFHCIAGADRTGSLAYVLNGVLGVSRHELETDWESTFYPKIPDERPDPEYWCRESHFNNGFSKYGDAETPWNDRIVLYLKDCGITDAEISEFRKIMLEDK